MSRALIVVGALCCIVAALHPGRAAAVEAEPIGSIRVVTGDASIRRGPDTLPAHPGFRICPGDILETREGGALGVMFRDDSTISLGPNSRVAIEGFAFAPAEGKMGLLARIFRGTVAYLSGLIGRLAPDTVRFETPVATIGIRGTRFAVKVEQ